MDKITIKHAKNRDLYIEDEEVTLETPDLSHVSDGYHTIAELYDHRITLFIALCRAQKRREYEIGRFVWRSKAHYDGSIMEGWFIMGIHKEKGEQISYHLPLSRWEETNFAETLERAPEWDGHTSQDVLNRLTLL